jgi:hypothetical protein
MGYVGVDDVDAGAAQAKDLGGTVHHAPGDIPGVGRFAVIADPQGAVITLFKGMGEAAPAPAIGTPGTVGWNELYAGEWQAAFAFYEKMFGWTKDQALDMGPMGTYQLFAAGGPAIGGMMTKPPMIPFPYWGYYFNVPAIDAAVARVTGGGGQILNGPMQVPGGQWIVQCMDPQGAAFALVAMQR